MQCQKGSMIRHVKEIILEGELVNLEIVPTREKSGSGADMLTLIHLGLFIVAKWIMLKQEYRNIQTQLLG